MKINNNISAVISNKHLLRNEGKLSISMEKLSSGFKINHAGDDPSGMAISNKMNAQIRGLNRASQNASDGMSVLETADGALSEVTSMIQRMRELSVQAANGTNSESDRQSIQDEITALTSEVQRVSDTTEFNTKKLLDGSLNNRIYTDGIDRVYISDQVPEGDYELSIDEMPTKATLKTTKTWTELASYLSSSLSADEEQYIDFNGTGTTLTGGMSGEDIYEKFRSMAETGEITVSEYSETISFESIGYGAEASLGIQMNPGLKDFLGFEWDEERNLDDPNKSYVKVVPGENAVITLDKTTSDFGSQATYSTVVKESGGSATRSVDGRRIKITDVGGFEMDFLIEDDMVTEYNNKETSYEEDTGEGVMKKLTVKEAKYKRGLLKEERDTLIEEREKLLETQEAKEKEMEYLTERVDALDEQIEDLKGRKDSESIKKRISLEEEKEELEEQINDLKFTLAETTAWDSIVKEDGKVDAKETELNTKKTELEAELSAATTDEEKEKIQKQLDEIEIELNGIASARKKEARIDEIDTEITTITSAISAVDGMPVEMEITDVGPMNLQVGANEGQQITVRIDSMSANSLYLDQVNVTSERGATRALEQLDEALAKVTTTLSNIGAYTNRLEHTVASLDHTSENMEQAISRIKDVDMATEMTEYTKYNVLQQAATSALSQANELPQTALQLLQ